MHILKFRHKRLNKELCSPSFTVRKIQNKITQSYDFLPIKLAKI